MLGLFYEHPFYIVFFVSFIGVGFIATENYIMDSKHRKHLEEIEKKKQLKKNKTCKHENSESNIGLQ